MDIRGKSYEGFAGRKSLGNHPRRTLGVRKGDPDMSLRHISPRSVEWYEALMEDEEGALPAHEAVALRTMKALEDAEIRIAIARAEHGPDGPLSYRFPAFQVRQA